MGELAHPLSIAEVGAEYAEKSAALADALATFQAATAALESAASIRGTYGQAVFARSNPAPSESHLRAVLLASAWRRVYEHLNIAYLAPASDRKRFEMALENPIAFTLENVRGTFGDYVESPRFHVLRGLAECFSALDPAYKSHTKVKIGADGLPKRIIVERVCDYGGYGNERVADVFGALAAVRGEQRPDRRELAAILAEAKENGAAWWQGIEVRRFGNGNAHLIFDRETLGEINRALAEFYGNVLPDVEPDAPKKRASTAVAKDLQFYWTPDSVLDAIGRNIGLGRFETVLEPSCGDGRVLDYMAKVNPQARRVGVEYHTGRAEQAREKGHKIYSHNFLETAPTPFDLVLMNPPFYGQHWRKHLDHARKFRADRGTLVCILPASAKYDGRLKDLPGEWRDLPVASFRASGTNIPTGYYFE